MFLYDSYLNKIKKLAKVKNTVFKYRVPILIAVSLSMASLFGFLFSKGAVVQNVEVLDEIVYGEDYTIQEAKVLFGDAEYQYAPEGSETWSKEYPRTPGTYKVRTVSKGGFGNIIYGKEVEFTIKPKEVDISISSESVVYGENPHYNVNLEYQDYVSNIDFDYEDLSKNKTNVTVNLDSVVIFDKDGKDVTSFYSLNTESKDITFNKRQVSLIPDILSKTYDGTSISYLNELKDESIESLGFEDQIDVKTIIKDSEGNILTSLPTKAGKYTCIVDSNSIITNNDGVETTSNYSFKCQSVDFEITRKEISVTTTSVEQVYNGQVLSASSTNEDYFLVDSILVDGHKLVIDEEKEKASIINVGKVDNIFALKVLDENNNDITENYNLNYNYGSLEITPLEIKVNPLELETFVYDGHYVSYFDGASNFESKNKDLPNEEQLEIFIDFVSELGEVYSSIKDAGKYKYKLNSFNVINGLKENYTIIIEEKEFEITPREITIKPFEIDDFEYNGSNYVYPNYYNNFEILNGNIIDGDNLSINLKYLNSIEQEVNAKDADTYLGKIASVSSDEYTNVSNYNFTFEDVNFEINKKQLTIKPSLQYLDNANGVYDGLIHNYNYLVFNNYLEVDNLMLPLGEELKITQVSFVNKENQTLDYKNAGDYTIIIESHDFNDGVNKDNYDITYLTEEVSIYKREVIIEPINFENKEYDGKEYTYPSGLGNFTYPLYTNEDMVLVEGENLSIEVVISGEKYNEVENPKNADTYTIKVKEGSLVGSENTLLDNYNFYFVDVSFTIAPRVVKIRVNEEYILGSKVYDGNIHSYKYEENNYVITSSSLVENEKVMINEVGFYLNGEYVNEVKDAGIYQVEILDIIALGDTILDNYDFIEESYDYEIEQREITIKPINFLDKVYDGEEYYYPSSNNNFDYAETSPYQLVENEEIFVYVQFVGLRQGITSPKDADVYTISIINVEGRNDTKVSNYYIHLETVSFEIFSRTIKIDLIQLEDKVYDGEYLDNYSIGYSYSSDTPYELLLDHQLSLYVVYNGMSNVKDADTYLVELDYYLINDGLVASENYKIECSSYEVNILPREITIKPFEFENKIYDGIYVSYSSYFGNFLTLSEVGLLEGENFKIVVRFNETQTQVKDASNYVVSIVDIIYQEGTLVQNYIINKEVVEFTIDPRTVYIKPIELGEKVYDGKVVTYPSINNFQYIPNIDSSNKFVGNDGVIIDVTIVGDMFGEVLEMKHADRYLLSVNSYSPINDTILSNYIIECIEKEDYIITPRKISLIPGGVKDKVYDGKAYKFVPSTFNAFTYEEGSLKLVEGESLMIDVVYLDNEGNPIDSAIYVGSYLAKVNDDPNSIVCGENTVLSDYIIDCSTTLFNITPREVHILFDVSLVEGESYYDGKGRVIKEDQEVNYVYKKNSLELVEGENISINFAFYNGEFRISGEEVVNAGTYIINIYDEDSYYLSSVDGRSHEEINKNYIFFFEDAIYRINPRVVNFSPYKIEDKVYDGEKVIYPNLYPNNFVINKGSFVNDEGFISKIYFYDENGQYSDRPLDSGTYTSCFDLRSCIWNDNTISTNYKLEFTETTFNINKKGLDIELLDLEDVYYDGTSHKHYPLTKSNCIIEGLVKEEKIEIFVEYYSLDGQEKDVIDAKEYFYTTRDELMVIYRDGQPCTKMNYYLNPFEDKSFIVNKANISVKATDCSKTYDGKEYSYFNGNEGKFELIEGTIYGNDSFTLEVEFYQNNQIVSPIDAGTYYVYPKELVGSRINNYNVTYLQEPSELIIEKRNVSVMYEDSNKVYDGLEFDTSKLKLVLNNFVDEDKVEVTSVAFTNNEGDNFSSIVDADTYLVNIESVNFLIGNLNNYELTFIPSKIVIERTKVHIIPYSTSNFIYGESEYTYPYEYSNYQEFEFEDINFSHIAFKIEFELFNNSLNMNFGTTAVEAGQYQLQVNYENTEISENKVTNFEIIIDEKVNSPFLEIIKRDVIVYTGDGEFIYDGKPHSVTDGFRIDESSSFNLLDNHYLQLSATQEVLSFEEVLRDGYGNVISYENNIHADIVYIDEENYKPVTHNYNVSYISGKITILPIELHVTSASNIDNPFKYNRETHSLVEFTNHNEDLLITHELAKSQDSLQARALNRYRDAGVYENKLSYFVYRRLMDNTRLDVTHNYQIIEETGTLVIEAVNLVIGFNNMSVNFKNEAYTYPMTSWYFEDNSGAIIGDTAFTFKYDIYNSNNERVYEMINAGIYNLKIYDVHLNGETIPSDNYTLELVNDTVTFEIKKINVRIDTLSESFVYDGTEHSALDYNVIYPSAYNKLFEDFSFEVDETKEYATVQYPGDRKENVFEMKVTQLSNMKNQTQNIEFEYHYGTIRITDTANVIYYGTYDSIKRSDLNYELRGLLQDGENGSWVYVDFYIYNYQLKYSLEGNFDEAVYVDYVYDVGKYFIVGDFDYRISYQGMDLTDYFTILNIDELYIEVYMPTICVKPSNKEKTYDGTPLTASKEDYTLFTLVDGNGFILSDSQLGINDRIEVTTDGYVEASTYKVALTSVNVFDEEGNNINYRYNIYYSPDQFDGKTEKNQFYARYKVNKRKIQIKSYGASKTYDGTPIYNNEYEYIQTNLVDWDLLEGHTLELNLSLKDKDGNKYSYGMDKVGTKINQLRFKFYDGEGNSVNSVNYSVTYLEHEDAYLVINPRRLIIKSNDASAVYDPNNRTPLICHDFTLISGELLEGHSIDVSEAIYGSLNHMGTIETDYIATAENTIYAYAILIKDKNGKTSVTSNYEIIAVSGTLTMYPPGTVLELKGGTIYE